MTKRFYVYTKAYLPINTLYLHSDIERDEYQLDEFIKEIINEYFEVEIKEVKSIEFVEKTEKDFYENQGLLKYVDDTKPEDYLNKNPILILPFFDKPYDIESFKKEADYVYKAELAMNDEGKEALYVFDDYNSLEEDYDEIRYYIMDDFASKGFNYKVKSIIK